MSIKIGGKDRAFALDFYSFRVAEKHHGVRITGSEFGDIGMGDFAKYLWIGLLADDAKLTEDKVLGWLRGASATLNQQCYDAVMDGIGSFGSFSEEEDQDVGKSQDGLLTGSKSSLSPTGS